MLGMSIITEADTVTKRSHGQIVRRLNRELMSKHGQSVLPQHFEERPETSPGGVWNYAPRSAAYQERKQKRYGHKRPNVKTGKMRRAVLGKVRVTSTQNKGTLITSGSGKHRLQNWQRAEIEAVSPKERRTNALWQQQRYKRLANSPQYRRKRRVGKT